jgi:protein-disulfide isomerase
MTEKNNVLHEHKEKVKTRRGPTSQFWKYASIVLLVLLVLSVYSTGFSLPSATDDAVVEDAVSYINAELLQGLATAELVSVTEENGLYKLDLNIVYTNGLEEEFSSYLSKDGTMLFPTALDIDGTEGTIEEETTEEETTEEETTEVETETYEVDITDDPFKGPEDATVTIVEFSDFECPYCSRAYTTIELLLEAYSEDVKLVYKHLPLSFHTYAQEASEASECAYDQDMFWEYYDALYLNQGSINSDYLVSLAEELGLDMDTFNSCLDSGEKTASVNADATAAASLGITGTPAFLINGELIVGAQAYETFEAAILQYL